MLLSSAHKKSSLQVRTEETNWTFTFTAIGYSMHYTASQSALVQDWHWPKKRWEKACTHNHEGGSTVAGARLCGCYPSNHQLGVEEVGYAIQTVAASNKACPFHQAWAALAGSLGSYRTNGNTRCIRMLWDCCFKSWAPLNTKSIHLHVAISGSAESKKDQSQNEMGMKSWRANTRTHTHTHTHTHARTQPAQSIKNTATVRARNFKREEATVAVSDRMLV